MRRQALRLLPLCLAIAGAARAQDPAPAADWALCPSPEGLPLFQPLADPAARMGRGWRRAQGIGGGALGQGALAVDGLAEGVDDPAQPGGGRAHAGGLVDDADVGAAHGRFADTLVFALLEEAQQFAEETFFKKKDIEKELFDEDKKKKEEEEPAAPPAPSNEELLLTEIRDLLKQQQQK